MAAGDLITKPGQAELRGLLLGRGTRYSIERWGGLGIPAPRTDDANYDDGDGAYPGADHVDVRQLLLTMNVAGTGRDNLGALLEALGAAWSPVRVPATTVPFVWMLRTGVKLRANVRPRPLDVPYGDLEPHGASAGLVGVLVALDPLIYSNTEQTQAITIANAAVTANANVTGGGAERTRPKLTITGPVTNPRITNGATGEAIRIDGVVGPLQTLVIDLTGPVPIVTLDGLDAMAGVRDDNEWIDLGTGAEQITYSRSVGAAPSTLTVAWRSARLLGV